MVKLRWQLLFFDAPLVRREVDKATRKALARAGAYIRKVAQRSMRRRKKISKPGKPPHSHAGFLRDWLYFEYEPADKTVVIGPARFRKGEAPNLLEFGGTVMRTHWRTGRTRRLTYQARPFMGPALEKAREKGVLPAFFANSVRGV